MFVHSRLGAHSCSARCSFMLASLLIHVQLAAYWCLARCPLMLSFLSALGTDRKIINTNLKSPFRKGGIETRNMRNFANYHVDVRRHTSGVVKTIASNASRRGTTSVTVRCGSISTQDIAIATIAEPTSTSPTMPKSVRKPSDRLPVNVVRHLPFPSISTVRCSTLRRRRFPKLRSVGW